MSDEAIIELADELMFIIGVIPFAKAIAAKERERCAKICEDHFMSDGDFCAKQIRGEG